MRWGHATWPANRMVRKIAKPQGVCTNEHGLAIAVYCRMGICVDDTFSTNDKSFLF